MKKFNKEKKRKNTKKFFRNKKNTAIVVAHIYVPSQKKIKQKTTQSQN